MQLTGLWVGVSILTVAHFLIYVVKMVLLTGLPTGT